VQVASYSVVASNKALAWSMTNYQSQKELKERELLSSLFLNYEINLSTFQSSP
jgi:coproporphyrinogen III oxidase-like Fe-S oxidoreductase